MRPVPILLGQLLLFDGSVLLIAVYATLWCRAHDHVVLTQLVAAERVELARITLPGTAPRVLLTPAGVLVFAPVCSFLWPAVGARLLGLTLVVATVWLIRHDVARHAVRVPGLPRFSAAALLLGYGSVLWIPLVALHLRLAVRVGSNALDEARFWQIGAPEDRR